MGGYLSSQLCTARERAGLSRRDLAELVGVIPRTVLHWETGERVPSLVDLCRVAIYTDVTVAQLLRDVDERREEIAAEVVRD